LIDLFKSTDISLIIQETTMNSISALIITSILTTVLSHTALSSELTSPGTYIIDKNHSGITFEINHLGYTNVIGRFNKISGNFIVKKDEASSLNVSVESASVDTNNDKRDAHIRSPDFFNAKQFPTIEFSSPLTIVKTNGQTTMRGTLKLLGVSKPITLNISKGKEGTDPWGFHRAGYSAKGVIKRSEYGMNFMQGGLSDEISVNINIEAIKQ
jgi:polyisoprenoid-binding protein YceI